jgi:transposase
LQGEKAEQDDLFFYGSLDSLVPQDDPFRRLDSLLDLTWLRQETKSLYSYTGRPSIDPVVIAKLMLIAYFKGIASERELMRQVQVNLAYRRFIHYRLSEVLPDHSNLTRARQRLGETPIRKFFEYALRLCVDAGLVGGELQCIDSTFVQADASLRSLRPRLVEVEAKRATQHLFRLLDEQAGGDADDQEPPKTKPPSRQSDYQVSRTDPDSGFYTRGGNKTKLGYLVHYAVDRTKQIITGVLTVSAHHNDVEQILPLVDQVAAQGIRTQAVAADRGYSSGAVYEGLTQRQIAAFIPPLENGVERQGYFGRSEFSYEPESDRYRCPNGSWLNRQGRSSENRYRARPQDCAACPLRRRCTPGKVRSLRISPYEDHLEAARELQASQRARRAAIERNVCSERSFAEAKDEHCLRRAQRRGLANMTIQALLTAAAMNFKRYLKAQTRVFPQAGAVANPISSPPCILS